MKRSNGFTLTEVLLAVMIVAIIGVALASLTTAASRESSLGNSRIILRNNLSAAMRQIREDIHSPNTVMVNTGGHGESNLERPIRFLYITQNIGGSPRYISYCFWPGDERAAAPRSARTGGRIYRAEYNNNNLPEEPCTVESLTDVPVFLSNVKFIPAENIDNIKYEVPFTLKIGGGAVAVRLILEIPNSNPVVNVATEEIFFGPSAWH